MSHEMAAFPIGYAATNQNGVQKTDWRRLKSERLNMHAGVSVKKATW